MYVKQIFVLNSSLTFSVQCRIAEIQEVSVCNRCLQKNPQVLVRGLVTVAIPFLLITIFIFKCFSYLQHWTAHMSAISHIYCLKCKSVSVRAAHSIFNPSPHVSWAWAREVSHAHTPVIPLLLFRVSLFFGGSNHWFVSLTLELYFVLVHQYMFVKARQCMFAKNLLSYLASTSTPVICSQSNFFVAKCLQVTFINSFLF